MSVKKCSGIHDWKGEGQSSRKAHFYCHLAKNAWQIPVYNGQITNVGIEAPTWSPPWRVYNGGHGSVDTLPIVAAISIPGGKTGAHDRPIRIADLGVTAAALSGLELKSTTAGIDLSKDLI